MGNILPARFYKFILRDTAQNVLLEFPVIDPQGGPAQHVVITCGNQTRLFQYVAREHEEHEGTGCLPEYPMVRDYDEVTPVCRVDVPPDSPKKKFRL